MPLIRAARFALTSRINVNGAALNILAGCSGRRQLLKGGGGSRVVTLVIHTVRRGIGALSLYSRSLKYERVGKW